MENLDPKNINLDSIDTLFEYEKQSRLIDNLTSEELKLFAKMYCKLYLKQQETIKSIMTI
jgi:hypothetical protein